MTEKAGPIGPVLAAARERRGWSLEEVATRTRIRSTLLARMEVDDFSGCGGAVYAKGHIRGYALAVGLDPEPLVAAFDATHDTRPPTMAAGTLLTTPVLERHPKRVQPSLDAGNRRGGCGCAPARGGRVHRGWRRRNRHRVVPAGVTELRARLEEGPGNGTDLPDSSVVHEPVGDRQR